MAFIGDINREPVVHTWRYKIDNAASSPYIRYFGNVVLGVQIIWLVAGSEGCSRPFSDVRPCLRIGPDWRRVSSE
jgi:hypothetical protein